MLIADLFDLHTVIGESGGRGGCALDGYLAIRLSSV